MVGAQLATERVSELLGGSRNASYVPIVLDDPTGKAVVRLCVMLRSERARCYPIVLREAFDAQVFLGGLVDQRGDVIRWLKIHVQHVDEMSRSPAAFREAISNAVLDKRWRSNAELMSRLQPGDVVPTPWEHDHPPPMLIDIKKRKLVIPREDDGGQWRLCRDDALLHRHGLPPYSTSLHRYLVLDRAEEEDAHFIPLTVDAPENEHTQSNKTFWQKQPSLVPFNLGCGLMMVQSLVPVTYERLVDYLGGSVSTLESGSMADAMALSGEMSEQPTVILGGGEESSSPSPLSSGRLFLGDYARAGRLLETLHLKLRMLSDAVGQVRDLVRETGMPLLNIRAEHFRVRLGPTGSALPFLWTAQAVLTKPGEAIPLPNVTGDSAEQNYFLPGRSEGRSIYRAKPVCGAMRGRGAVKIDRVIEDAGQDGETIVEGTLSTHERVQSSRGDLVIMRLPIDGRRFEFHATIDIDEAMSSGKWRFRSTWRPHTAPVNRMTKTGLAEVLLNAEGQRYNDIEFDLLPMLSTPHDLYSLGVLATRTMLVDSHATLPKALDEVFSLARRVADDYDPDVGLPLRIFGVFERDVRWRQSLGSHRLTSEAISPNRARKLLGDSIWWNVLAMILRTFPGLGPDSTCGDFSDCSPDDPAGVFDPMLEDLDTLLAETRNLITYDWQANREIHEVIKQFRRS